MLIIVYNLSMACSQRVYTLQYNSLRGQAAFQIVDTIVCSQPGRITIITRGQGGALKKCPLYKLWLWVLWGHKLFVNYKSESHNYGNSVWACVFLSFRSVCGGDFFIYSFCTLHWLTSTWLQKRVYEWFKQFFQKWIQEQNSCIYECVIESFTQLILQRCCWFIQELNTTTLLRCISQKQLVTNSFVTNRSMELVNIVS